MDEFELAKDVYIIAKSLVDPLVRILKFECFNLLFQRDTYSF